MPKRFSKKRKLDTSDPNVAAFRLVQRITGDGETVAPKANVVPMKPRKNPAAVALGRKGGLKSAAGRLQKISPDRRISIAQHAARERWKKAKGDG
jgi:hypothetical protein